MKDSSHHLDKRIAFQGVLGAHADLACRRFYPYMTSVPYPSFEDAVQSVERGETDICMIPIENSTAGRVAEIHYLLPDTELSITGEYFLPISHCLAACKGATRETIKTVCSHPQALAQCKKNLQEAGYHQEAAANTAMAAQAIAEAGDITRAALCSSLSAELYGLEKITPDMQDNDDNTTVFITLEKEPADTHHLERPVITSMLIEARNIPAALYKAMGGFATNRVNLLKIESYIPGGNSRQALFFITFEGSSEEENVRLAIEELGFFCRRTKMLGAYYADPARLLASSSV